MKAEFKFTLTEGSTEVGDTLELSAPANKNTIDGFQKLVSTVYSSGAVDLIRQVFRKFEDTVAEAEAKAAAKEQAPKK